ncbi:MAG: adenylosuccinate lyase [Candidatus Hydrothermarchaeales archaeon]
MAIHPIEFRYGSDEMKNIFEEGSKLQRLLDVEAALARAHAKVGSIPKNAADEIAGKASTKYVKVERVKEIEGEVKHDIMAVVLALSEVCDDSGKYVHLGATSYDIVDTANALQFKEALKIVRRDLFELEGILLGLAERHISTVAVGRTHGQHATSITYGLKFAVWAREVRRHIQRIEESGKRVFVGKMSGAVGTQASFGEKGIEIQRLVMEDLGLIPAEVSSQVVQRDRYAELISLLALIAATLDKIGKEIRNLMRTEIAEVGEPFGEKQVGSSTMPHKRNPINSEKVCGLARVIKSNVFVALENVSLEHERDLTNSSAERVIIPESFVLLDEMLKTMKQVLGGLVLNPENIERNLGLAKGLNMAEAVMLALVEKGMSRQKAHELLRQLSMNAYKEDKSLKEVLKNSEAREYLSEDEIEKALDAHRYIGTAVEQVKKVLELAKKERS